MSRFLRSALFLLILSACSRTHVNVPMPPPPANLKQPCASLPPIPAPLLDPERAIWESDIMSAYASCAARHWLMGQAWEDAVKAPQK